MTFVAQGMLTDGERFARRQLAISRGGFKRSAAAEVAGADLSLLVALVNKPWLSDERKTDRYQIHELLRQYGTRKLKTALEQVVRSRHSSYFCAYLKEWDADRFGVRRARLWASSSSGRKQSHLGRICSRELNRLSSRD